MIKEVKLIKEDLHRIEIEKGHVQDVASINLSNQLKLKIWVEIGMTSLKKVKKFSF